MTPHQKLVNEPPQSPKTWLVTRMAGAVGGNVLEALLKLVQRVVGPDNFATGYQHNLVAVHSLADPIATKTAYITSSTYGDHPALPMVEDNIGKPLCSYAVTKYVNDLCADVLSKWVSPPFKRETNSDFSFTQTAIQANLPAATTSGRARNQAHNMAVGDRTTLKQLFTLVRDNLMPFGVPATAEHAYQDFRAGDA